MKNDQRQVADRRPGLKLLVQALEKFAVRFFAVVSIALASLVIGTTIWADCKKALWFDELITLYLGRLPFGDVWHALTHGVDNNPPLLYLPVHLFLSFIPVTELAVRLPSTLASIAGCWCLCRIAGRYVSMPFAIAAAFIPLTTFFVQYVDEGRAYACAVCFAAFAFYFWQRATCTEGNRVGDLIGLALSIALALASHFSAQLLVAAIGAGETVRTLSRRRIDWPVVLSIGAAALSILIYLPILHALKQLLAGSVFWSNLSFANVLSEARYALTPLRYLLLMFVLALLLRRQRNGPSSKISSVPAHELVAWITILLAPLEGYLQGRFTGAFAMRYAIAMVLPFSLGVAILCDRVSRSSTAAAMAIVCLSSFLGIWWIRATVHDFPNEYVLFKETLESRLPPSEPLVVGSPIMFLPVYYYAPETLQKRMTYFANSQLASKNTGTNTPDTNLILLSKVAPVAQLPYQSLLSRRQSFALLLHKKNKHFTWIDKQLIADGYTLQKLGCASIGCLYQVNTRSSN